MKVDLHTHTCYSYDSNASPREMVDAAIKKGVSCLAITDHGKIQGAIEAMEYARGKPILIIPGIEVKSKEGDILALNVKEKIPNKLSAKETIKKIKEAGGLAIIPHPFGWFCSFNGDLEGLIKEIDGIEIFNASLFGGNEKALAFARQHNLPWTCGSDAHFPNFVGKCYLEIPGRHPPTTLPSEGWAPNLTAEEVLTIIKNKGAKINGKEANFFEKVIDHAKRNLAKIQNASRTKSKI